MFLTVAALTALAGGGIAPARVQAGCGDGVGSLHDMAKDVGLWAKTATRSHSERPFGNPHKPCNGPACQRGSLPFMPAVPPVPPSVNDWSCLPALLALPHPSPHGSWTDFILCLPYRFPQSIFHPPRFV